MPILCCAEGFAHVPCIYTGDYGVQPTLPYVHIYFSSDSLAWWAQVLIVRILSQ